MVARMPRVAPPRTNSRSLRMAVTAHDQHVGRAIRRVGQDGARDIDVGRDDVLGRHAQAVPPEMIRDVAARHRLLAFDPLADGHDLDRLRAPQKRQGIRDGACRRPAAVPADQDAIEPGLALLDIGHDQDRAPGIEQRGLDDQVVGPAARGLGLTHEREIEAARDAAELVAGFREGRFDHARLGRQPRAPRELVELRQRGFGGALRLSPQLLDAFDPLRRNVVAQHRDGNFLVKQRNCGQMGIECAGQRDRIIDRCIVGRRQVHDHVPDRAILLRPRHSILITCVVTR